MREQGDAHVAHEWGEEIQSVRGAPVFLNSNFVLTGFQYYETVYREEESERSEGRRRARGSSGGEGVAAQFKVTPAL